MKYKIILAQLALLSLYPSACSSKPEYVRTHKQGAVPEKQNDDEANPDSKTRDKESETEQASESADETGKTDSPDSDIPTTETNSQLNCKIPTPNATVDF